MAISERIQDLSARCLALVTRYHLGERREEAWAAMVVEVQGVVGQIRALHPTEDEVDERILRPMEAYLLARHGHEAGGRILDDFLRVFRAAGLALSQNAPAGGRDPGGPHDGRAAESFAVAPAAGRPAHRTGEGIR